MVDGLDVLRVKGIVFSCCLSCFAAQTFTELWPVIPPGCIVCGIVVALTQGLHTVCVGDLQDSEAVVGRGEGESCVVSSRASWRLLNVRMTTLHTFRHHFGL